MKTLFSIGLAALILWFAGFLAFNYKINSYKKDETVKTDAIIVLTGGKNRISEAVELLNRGAADRLFISGVQEGISLKEIRERKDVKIKTDRKISLENKSKNTVENAIQTNDWIKKNNISSSRLVTSNYHIPRSLEEFRAQNHRLHIVPHPVYSDNVSKKWWKNGGSFYLIASEYNKFLYVYIRTKLFRAGGPLK